MSKSKQTAAAGAATQASGAKTGAAKVATVTKEFVPGVFNTDISALLEGKDFPFSVYVTNNTPQPIVEAELHVSVAPHSTVEATVRDGAQLHRAAANFEQLCEINKWTDGITVSDTAPAEDAPEGGDGVDASKDAA